MKKWQVGGYVVGYKGVVLVTVRGAGHAVPSYQPERALAMISSFLQGKLPPSLWLKKIIQSTSNFIMNLHPTNWNLQIKYSCNNNPIWSLYVECHFLLIGFECFGSMLLASKVMIHTKSWVFPRNLSVLRTLSFSTSPVFLFLSLSWTLQSS